MSYTTEESDWRGLDNINSSSQPLPPSPPKHEFAKPALLPRGPSPPSAAHPLPQPEAQTDGVAPTVNSSSDAALEQSAPAPEQVILPEPSNTTAADDTNPPGWRTAFVESLDDMSNPVQPELTPLSHSTRGGANLGRARGTSRGGRPPKIKIEPPADGLPPKINRGGRPRGSRAGVTSGARSMTRGGRTRGRGSRAGATSASTLVRALKKDLKRKRKDASGLPLEDGDPNGDLLTDSSEEITALPTQSRSGRRITQAATYVPPVFEPSSQSGQMKMGLPGIGMSMENAQIQGSGKKPAKRKRVALSAVCTNCGRGHSPQSNQIVFCDGCNTPWHQYCHDRPITPSVIQEEDKEWHCADCLVHVEEAGYLANRTAFSESTGLAERRNLLNKMEKSELVALLLKASSQFPALGVVRERAAEVAGVASTTAEGAVAKGHREFEYEEVEPLPYPKPGQGVTLPPELDDMDMLVDENIDDSYSHSWVGADGLWTGDMARANAELRNIFAGGMGRGGGGIAVGAAA